MKISSKIISIFLALFLFSLALATSSSPDQVGEFIHCLSLDSNNATLISQLIFTPQNASFLSVWNASINPKFDTPTSPKPKVIVTPVEESQIQITILCAKTHDLQVRIRCGGHDFEAISYVAPIPFVMIDLVHFKKVNIDKKSKTAWVQGGVEYGDLYYRINKVDPTLAFPGGVWSTVGVGGHISGGGYGALLRKNGLAGDHVLDARLIDVNGRILDRKSMGEDLFWAIRGGIASSFGVITAWKLQLVTVPKIVTMFQLSLTLEQNATAILHRWQYVAPGCDRDLFLRGQFASEYISGNSGNKTIRVAFEGLYLGRVYELIPVMDLTFPELGLKQENCTEMKWIQAALVLSDFASTDPIEILLNRSAPSELAIKGKSDFIQKPLSIEALEGLWQLVFENDVSENITMTPYGGRMDDIPVSAIPFPHRAGNLYMLLEAVIFMDNPSPETRLRRLEWQNKFRAYLDPYVSKYSRGAYVNYNDVDLGVAHDTYEQASIWGTKYWKTNFRRLVEVKAKVDPGNFFRHPQSIPVFPSGYADM